MGSQNFHLLIEVFEKPHLLILQILQVHLQDYVQIYLGCKWNNRIHLWLTKYLLLYLMISWDWEIFKAPFSFQWIAFWFDLKNRYWLRIQLFCQHSFEGKSSFILFHSPSKEKPQTILQFHQYCLNIPKVQILSIQIKLLSFSGLPL